ncbi:uncharacterized protein L201_005374 [Kwoniella dendrophila CBS 6074]|uniref:WSC domain-containing protein n=1 Tax=Kwoniella dendrophila CBS 6074 TaxID=1295534 RepID=A0AAX4JZW6_9TREE
MVLITSSNFLLSCFITAINLVYLVKGDDLFIGCGDEIDFKEMVFTTPYKSVCYKGCKDSSYTYYTHKPDLGQCICYIYPPPAAEYMPGSPGLCNGTEYTMQYNLIKSDWSFERCYSASPINLTEKSSDSFKACMDRCAPNEVAIARPTGIFPGHTNCVCASTNNLEGLEETECDYQKYFAYTHTPVPAITSKRATRAVVIAERRALASE